MKFISARIVGAPLVHRSHHRRYAPSVVQKNIARAAGPTGNPEAKSRQHRRRCSRNSVLYHGAMLSEECRLGDGWYPAKLESTRWRARLERGRG